MADGAGKSRRIDENVQFPELGLEHFSQRRERRCVLKDEANDFVPSRGQALQKFACTRLVRVISNDDVCPEIRELPDRGRADAATASSDDCDTAA